MRNIILFDDDNRDNFLPLTYTKPVCELRLGILSIREKWEKHLEGKGSFITQEYLSEKFPIHVAQDNYLVNGSALPSEHLAKLVLQLEDNEALLNNGELIAARLSEVRFKNLIQDEQIEELSGFDLENTPFIKINQVWDLFRLNAEAIEQDYQLLTKDRRSKPLSFTNRVLQEDRIFVEEGAKIECASLNAGTGPIYIGKDAEIMEGANIRGPFAICEGAQVKMGAKIYGPTTIGPYSKAGGEIKNVVISGYSNKGHEGYLGNAVLGEWCNLGADTNNSNLKNNYEEVKIWSYPDQRFVKTGLTFCGLIMGDHSKTGINTMFNTGTVVGVSANIFGDGYPRNYIPSFSWGGAAGFKNYNLRKAFDVAERVMGRRKIELTDVDKKILDHIYTSTAAYRPWDS